MPDVHPYAPYPEAPAIPTTSQPWPPSDPVPFELSNHTACHPVSAAYETTSWEVNYVFQAWSLEWWRQPYWFHWSEPGHTALPASYDEAALRYSAAADLNKGFGTNGYLEIIEATSPVPEGWWPSSPVPYAQMQEQRVYNDYGTANYANGRTYLVWFYDSFRGFGQWYGHQVVPQEPPPPHSAVPAVVGAGLLILPVLVGLGLLSSGMMGGASNSTNNNAARRRRRKQQTT